MLGSFVRVVCTDAVRCKFPSSSAAARSAAETTDGRGGFQCLWEFLYFVTKNAIRAAMATKTIRLRAIIIGVLALSLLLLAAVTPGVGEIPVCVVERCESSLVPGVVSLFDTLWPVIKISPPVSGLGVEVVEMVVTVCETVAGAVVISADQHTNRSIGYHSNNSH